MNYSDDSSLAVISSNDTDNGVTVMFCWGNTANGELGLGGIEDQHILAPREVQFRHGDNINKSNFLIHVGIGHFNLIATLIKSNPPYWHFVSEKVWLNLFRFVTMVDR